MTPHEHILRAKFAAGDRTDLLPIAKGAVLDLFEEIDRLREGPGPAMLKAIDEAKAAIRAAIAVAKNEHAALHEPPQLEIFVDAFWRYQPEGGQHVGYFLSKATIRSAFKDALAMTMGTRR